MKKILAALSALLIILSSFSACSEEKEKTGKLSVIATIFPEYDYVRQILGEREDVADLTLLLDNGVDLHSFKPSAADIVKISECDLFIYVGGESDEWAEDVLKTAKNKNMKVLNLTEILGSGAKIEETVEGMEKEEEGEEEIDEHVWLSLKNSKLFVEKIRDAIITLDESGREIYTKNAADFINKLEKLDGEYENAVKNANKKTLLFADRFPFRYLADDYGLSYYAAFSGCSAESEASFETVAFLSKKVDELSLSYVLTTESSDGKIAETVISSSASKNAEILKMNSMQSTFQDSASYLSIMKENLEILKKALM